MGFTSIAETAGGQLKLALAGEAFRIPPKIRATKRYAEWRRQVTQALAYLKDRHPEQARELIDEFEQRLAEGPDFIFTRPKSRLCDAPKVNLDRNGRAKVLFLFRALARKSWEAKASKKHRGVITRTVEDVMLALVYLAGRYGRVFPSMLGLAHLARCCKQSVATALNVLEQLGFITRIRRMHRVSTPLGDRGEQTSNAYLIHPPRTAMGRIAVAVFSSESNYSPACEAEYFLFLSQERCHEDEGERKRLAELMIASSVPTGGGNNG